MITGNNVNKNIDEKIADWTLISLIELVEEFFDDRFYDDELHIYTDYKEDFIISKVVSCLKTPLDFYTGVEEAFIYHWEYALYKYLGKHSWDKPVSFDEVADSLSLESIFSEKSPKNQKELSVLANEFRIKKKYYELSRWLKWSAIECEEIKSKFEFINQVDEISARKWVENTIKEYGKENLHIADFLAFGTKYGIIVTFDSVWRSLNNPSKLKPITDLYR